MDKLRVSSLVFLATILGQQVHAQWTYVSLRPNGAVYSVANGASWNKQVGTAGVDGVTRASLWSGTAASWVDLHPIGSISSMANGVSGVNQVGLINVSGGFSHASLWSGTAASFVDLHPAGAINSEAFGVSADVQVGWYATAGGTPRACLWHNTAASMVDLNPVGASGSSAYGVTEEYQVGSAGVEGVERASLWYGTAASWVDLHPVGSTWSAARGASGASQVGQALIGGVYHAGLWSGTAASWEDLHPAGATHSNAVGASGVNQVGMSIVGGVSRASIWCGTADSWHDLHALLPEAFSYSAAYSMSTDGVYDYVAGRGINDTTDMMEALLWTRLVRFHPNSFSLFRGNLISGGLSELLASDDQRLVAQAGLTLFAGESPLQLVVTGTSPMEEPCELRFAVEAHVSTPGLRQTVYLFNYVTGQYEEVGFWPGSVSDSIAEVTVTTNPERFVQPGTREIKAKIAYTQVGLVLHWPWYAHFDHTYWTIRD
jgi:hypothetical protein